ncbi:MAG: hypothetical protein IJ882_02270 [Paludibacteraceae bacterium]|nr:hypothetical protein [Paludibacteraceae bacterium]
MKRELAKRLNLYFWFILAAILMGYVYKVWSGYGSYTLGSFLASAFIHGGPCALFGFTVDEWIDHYYDKKENKQ